MIVIRLARGGAKKKPFYRIVVAPKAMSRDGRYVERLGYFNPVARGQELPLSIDLERLDAWVKKGAQLSGRVASLVKQAQKAS
jgi:small subunit ribosomal protein S16